MATPRVTNEESYLFQKFLRGAVGTNNIDSEARLGYFPAQLIQWRMLGYSGGTFPIDVAIEQAAAVVVLGSDLKSESAGFAYRVIQATTKNETRVVVAGSAQHIDQSYEQLRKYRPAARPGSWPSLDKGHPGGKGLENRAFIDADTAESSLRSARPSTESPSSRSPRRAA